MKLVDLKDLFGKNIFVKLKNGRIFEGVFDSFTWAYDDDDNRESISLESFNDGLSYMLYLDEIEKIELL